MSPFKSLSELVKSIFLCVVVTGPEVQSMKVGVGHRLDVASSGVLSMVI